MTTQGYDKNTGVDLDMPRYANFMSLLLIYVHWNIFLNRVIKIN